MMPKGPPNVGAEEAETKFIKLEKKSRVHCRSRSQLTMWTTGRKCHLWVNLNQHVNFLRVAHREKAK